MSWRNRRGGQGSVDFDLTKHDVQFMIDIFFTSFKSAQAQICMESLNERHADVECCLGTTW